MDLVESVTAFAAGLSVTSILVGVVVLLLTLNWARHKFLRPANAPPLVPSPVPWVGNIVAFGERPIDFLLDCFQKYGPVFSFTMFGTEVTYLLGSEASNLFWVSQNDHLNAEDLYRNITVPVFGKGIAFDVPHKVFSEQKGIAKEGLTQVRFARYVPLIEQECRGYLARWGDKGETNLFHAMAEMIVFTATRCLHGKETRDSFDETVANLYADLDGGFSPLAWFFPYWMPFPSFRRRDRAHVEIMRRFREVIQKRRQGEQGGHDDMLETFMTAKYSKVEDGRGFEEHEIGGLLIALLLAGQHTSSTTSSWFGFYICSVPGLQERLYQEQLAALGPNPNPLQISDLARMPLLHACVRETLRLRPPIMTLMRKARAPLEVEVGGRKYVVPTGAQVCVSPTCNGRLPTEWDDAETFNPERFIKRNEDGTIEVTTGEHIEKGGKFKWVPFGAGRHRCIGFEFAQIQIRCVWSTMLRMYELELPTGRVPAVNYRTMIHTPLDPQIRYRRRAAPKA